MLLIAILLTSGLMAASEVPELLTLTDNITNDFELACQHLPGSCSQQIVRSASSPVRWLAAPISHSDRPACFSAAVPFEEQTSPPPSNFGIQRK